MKKQIYTPGAVVQIDLADGTHCYARLLTHASAAFHDYKGSEDLAVDEIIKLPILFIIAIMRNAVTSGRWRKVGVISLERVKPRIPPRFIQDAIHKAKYSLYFEDGSTRAATREECQGLERAAVWSANHVEDRLYDHYAGVPNKWLESMRI